ncbi:hypothetical protein [Pseudescherichia sp.]|nr:hypothetical protein [Pseudescherichia sp.]
MENPAILLLTCMAAKQKPHALTLGWNEKEGIVLAFNEAHGG